MVVVASGDEVETRDTATIARIELGDGRRGGATITALPDRVAGSSA
jgi:hypothetical protein